MKCEIPGCRRVLDPDDTYETDSGGEYRKVCRECYEKLNGAVITQAGAGRPGSAEGKACKAVTAPIQLSLAM